MGTTPTEPHRLTRRRPGGHSGGRPVTGEPDGVRRRGHRPTAAALPHLGGRRAVREPAAPVEAVAIGARGVWFQLDVVDHAAYDRVRAAGIGLVMDRCPAIEWPAHGPRSVSYTHLRAHE